MDSRPPARRGLGTGTSQIVGELFLGVCALTNTGRKLGLPRALFTDLTDLGPVLPGRQVVLPALRVRRLLRSFPAGQTVSSVVWAKPCVNLMVLLGAWPLGSRFCDSSKLLLDSTPLPW